MVEILGKETKSKSLTNPQNIEFSHKGEQLSTTLRDVVVSAKNNGPEQLRINVKDDKGNHYKFNVDNPGDKDILRPPFNELKSLMKETLAQHPEIVVPSPEPVQEQSRSVDQNQQKTVATVAEPERSENNIIC